MPPQTRSEDSTFVEGMLREAGIDLWGAASNQPVLPFAPTLPTAVSLLARLDLRTLTRLEQGDLAAYGAEYRRLNSLLDRAADELVVALLERGRQAVAMSATVYEPLPPSGDWLAAGVFAHKTAATRAGLGWIGKTGLFVSPEAGPKLRLATVFTDLALPVGTPVMQGRCGSCRACVDACPAHAGRDVSWQAGMARDLLFDAAACERHMDSLEPTAGHTICGLCVAACPFGRTRSS
jgi:epoxyqueuosine reductase